MTVNSTVYHIRLSDFELHAERVIDPSLRTRAVVVISSHHQNGTLISVSAEAGEDGLFPGMKVSLARRMSHSALFLPYNGTLYSRMNHYIYKTICGFSPVVEPAVFGQYFVDMTGMDFVYKNSMQAGSMISNTVRSRIEMPNRIGISRNKLVSHISTAVVPERIHEVRRGDEADFLSPLHSAILPSARESPVMKMIRFLWLSQVRQIRKATEDIRIANQLFGRNSLQLRREANGEDFSTVMLPKKQARITKQKILQCDTNDADILAGVVRTLAEEVAFTLRKESRIAKKVRLEIHYTDGFRSSRTGKILRNSDRAAAGQCCRLFEKANTRRNRVRSILIDASGLEAAPRQVELFELPEPEDTALDSAVDKIRRKFGFSAICSAAA